MTKSLGGKVSAILVSLSLMLGSVQPGLAAMFELPAGVSPGATVSAAPSLPSPELESQAEPLLDSILNAADADLPAAIGGLRGQPAARLILDSDGKISAEAGPAAPFAARLAQAVTRVRQAAQRDPKVAEAVEDVRAARPEPKPLPAHMKDWGIFFALNEKPDLPTYPDGSGTWETHIGEELRPALEAHFPRLAQTDPIDARLPPPHRFRSTTLQKSGFEPVFPASPSQAAELSTREYLRHLAEGRYPIFDWHDLELHWPHLFKNDARRIADIAGTALTLDRSPLSRTGDGRSIAGRVQAIVAELLDEQTGGAEPFGRGDMGRGFAQAAAKELGPLPSRAREKVARWARTQGDFGRLLADELAVTFAPRQSILARLAERPLAAILLLAPFLMGAAAPGGGGGWISVLGTMAAAMAIIPGTRIQVGHTPIPQWLIDFTNAVDDIKTFLYYSENSFTVILDAIEKHAEHPAVKAALNDAALLDNVRKIAARQRHPEEADRVLSLFEGKQQAREKTAPEPAPPITPPVGRATGALMRHSDGAVTDASLKALKAHVSKIEREPYVSDARRALKFVRRALEEEGIQPQIDFIFQDLALRDKLQRWASEDNKDLVRIWELLERSLPYKDLKAQLAAAEQERKDSEARKREAAESAERERQALEAKKKEAAEQARTEQLKAELRSLEDAVLKTKDNKELAAALKPLALFLRDSEKAKVAERWMRGYLVYEHIYSLDPWMPWSDTKLVQERYRKSVLWNFIVYQMPAYPHLDDIRHDDRIKRMNEQEFGRLIEQLAISPKKSHESILIEIMGPASPSPTAIAAQDSQAYRLGLAAHRALPNWQKGLRRALTAYMLGALGLGLYFTARDIHPLASLLLCLSNLLPLSLLESKLFRRTPTSERQLPEAVTAPAGPQPERIKELIRILERMTKLTRDDFFFLYDTVISWPNHPDTRFVIENIPLREQLERDSRNPACDVTFGNLAADVYRALEKVRPYKELVKAPEPAATEAAQESSNLISLDQSLWSWLSLLTAIGVQIATLWTMWTGADAAFAMLLLPSFLAAARLGSGAAWNIERAGLKPLYDRAGEPSAYKSALSAAILAGAPKKKLSPRQLAGALRRLFLRWDKMRAGLDVLRPTAEAVSELLRKNEPGFSKRQVARIQSAMARALADEMGKRDEATLNAEYQAHYNELEAGDQARMQKLLGLNVVEPEPAGAQIPKPEKSR